MKELDLTNDFDEVSGTYHNALNGMLQALREMSDAKDLMDVAGLQIELEVIAEYNGDEKKVGSTEAARQRAYEIARSKNTRYLAARDHYYSARNDHKYHQAMVRLFELRLQFLKELAKNG